MFAFAGDKYNFKFLLQFCVTSLKPTANWKLQEKSTWIYYKIKEY